MSSFSHHFLLLENIMAFHKILAIYLPRHAFILIFK